MKSNNRQRRGSMNRALRWHLLVLASDGAARRQCSAFGDPRPRVPSALKQSLRTTTTTTRLFHRANRLDGFEGDPAHIRPAKLPAPTVRFARRSLLSGGATAALLLLLPPVALADFAPGGTLLDREVTVTYGNPDASPTRRRDNSNVLFAQDNFFKFGAAAPWIPPGSTEFPKTMPFVLSQQRYDALKKYGERIVAAAEEVRAIGAAGGTDGTGAAGVPDREDPAYQLRALGLLANSFLASENTGTTNELMLARWYVNEIYLRIGDYRDALGRGDAREAGFSYACLTKAMNSYLTLLNRSITSKVGEPFGYLADDA